MVFIRPEGEGFKTLLSSFQSKYPGEKGDTGCAFNRDGTVACPIYNRAGSRARGRETLAVRKIKFKTNVSFNTARTHIY